ncbi:MAG: RDD family protein [Acidobacteria bacterium]|nr:RDD family protein [Acidobacteriota bacterium]
MRRPDHEPLLFDLPLDRPTRDDEAEPVLERQPQRPPPSTPSPRSPQTAPRRSAPAAGKAAAAREEGAAPAPKLPLAAAAALPARLAPPAAQPTPATPATPAITEEAPLLWPRDLRPGPTAPAAARSQAAGAKIAGGRAGIGRRLAAGAADLLVHVAVAVLALAGCRYLGVFPALPDWPAFSVFLLSFSFLYTVVPLAFWGHTLGMTWAGLTAESLEGEPLSFDQTARRWLGALLTLAALGLPLLVALTGRSLSDRLSGSRTFAA